MDLQTIVAIVLTAIISGAGGYSAALNRSNLRMTLLERDTKENKSRWEGCQQELKEIAQDNANRLAVLLRLVIDIARHSGIELRTADILEITSLGPTGT